MTVKPCPEKYQRIVDEAIKLFDGQGYHTNMQPWARQKYGVSIETCWIADRKRASGYNVRKAPNALN
jgi:hypothetical protein